MGIVFKKPEHGPGITYEAFGMSNGTAVDIFKDGRYIGSFMKIPTNLAGTKHDPNGTTTRWALCSELARSTGVTNLTEDLKELQTLFESKLA